MAILDRLTPEAFRRLAAIVDNEQQKRVAHRQLMAAAAMAPDGMPLDAPFAPFGSDTLPAAAPAVAPPQLPPGTAPVRAARRTAQANVAGGSASGVVDNASGAAGAAGAADTGFVRVAKATGEAALTQQGFRRVAGGMYRRAHEVWAVRPDPESEDNYVLVRMREERLNDFRD